MVMHKIILTTQKIGYEFPHGSLFKNATLTIASNERIGLVGKNGSGKSTLLKILDGTVEPTEGKISSQCVSYYLPQINFSLFNSDEDVKTYVEKHRESWVLIKVALHRWSKTSQIIAEQKIKTLSGGETMMLHLAIAQSKRPDLLLLDEPTNHLDAEGLVILRDFLTSFQGAFVIVSHDPFLLDLVVDHIWELNEGVVRKYGGNYSYYREQKEIEQESKARDYESARKEVRKVKRSESGMIQDPVTMPVDSKVSDALNLMKEHSIIAGIPKPLTKDKYLEIESRFLLLCQEIKMSPARLDLAMWYLKTGSVLK